MIDFRKPIWRESAETLHAKIEAAIQEYHDARFVTGSTPYLRQRALTKLKELGFSEADAARWLDGRPKRIPRKAA